MSSRTVDQVDEWDPVSFRGGYAGLRTLADREFSGVVLAGPARLFMLNGTAVGILGGDIEQFEDADGTAREAPHEALPLLAVMEAQGQDAQGQYYTEDTSISEVDSTLSSGSFTGYVELSENVLSGDYYVVYHQGRSMSVAWVGSSGRLITDDEAFEQADGEVGIYEVFPADIDPVEIPDAGGSESTDDVMGGGGAGDGSDTSADRDTERSTGSGADSSGQQATAERSDSEQRSSTTDDRSPEEWARATRDEPDDTSTTESTDARATDEREDTTPTETQSDQPTGGPPGSKSIGGRETGTGSRGRRDSPRSPEREETRPVESDTNDGDAPDPGRQDERERQPDDQRRDDEPERRHHESETAGESGQEADGVPTDPASQRREDRTGSAPDQPSTTTETVEPAATGHETEPASELTGPDQSDATETRTPADDESDGGVPDFETRSIPSLDPERSTQFAGATSNNRDRPAQETQSSESQDVDRRQTDTTANAQSEAPVRGQPDQSETPPQRQSERSEPSTGQAEPSSTRQPDETGTSSERQADQPASPDRQTAQPESSQPRRRDQRTQRSTEAAEGTPDQSSPPAGTDRRADQSAGSDESASTDRRSRSNDRVRELRQKLDKRTAEVSRLESELSTLEDDAEDLRAERDSLQSQLREANEEIARLEERVSSLRGQLPDQVTGTDPSQRLRPDEALRGTNLFVRYDSKSEATLADARDGSADPEDVDANLRIQYHTQFEAEGTTVDGRPFHEFLTSCLEYQFVEWLVRKLLYEIRDTGHSTEMEVVYDALPNIDRIELNGQVSITYVEDGEEHREQERYDVVVRDRMGNPLIVANINDRKQPATKEQMTDLITTTEKLGNTSSSLAAAFLVTKSFFDPEALETAEEATASGLFSRSKRASFVNLSRSDGYHLCLLEAREGEFNMAVPEL